MAAEDAVSTASTVTSGGDGTIMQSGLPEITYFYDQGNLRLLIRSEDDLEDCGAKHIFVVSSHVMSLMCGPWSAMLDPEKQFAEANSDTISLYGDNPSALKILFRIAHLQFDLVPKILTMNELLHVSVVVDKYQAMELVLPFLSSWAQSFAAEITQGSDAYESWLCIAWVFGWDDIFELATTNIILDCTTNAEGRLMDSQGVNIREILPCNILGDILGVRNMTVNKILESIRDLTNDAFHRSKIGYVCKSKSSPSKTCDTLMLGSLVNGLNMWGIREYSGWTPSIRLLVTALLNLEFHTLDTSEHVSCSLSAEIKQCVQSAVQEMPSAVSSRHRCHMYRVQDIVQLSVSCSHRREWTLYSLFL